MCLVKERGKRRVILGHAGSPLKDGIQKSEFKIRLESRKITI